MITRGAARASATERLRSAGDETAALDADLLVAHVCSIPKEVLYAHPGALLTVAEEAALEEAVSRRSAGEPIAYIRGYKEFFGLRIAVDRRVLIPRPETEVLVEAALAYVRRAGRLGVVEVGTGSGAVAIAISMTEPRTHVIATDVSAAALEVARGNVDAYGLARRVELREGDLLAPIAAPVDVVVANLPYLRADSIEKWVGERTSLFFEPREAVVAGADGLDVIRRCIAQLPGKIAEGGAAFFECDPPQVDLVQQLLRVALGGSTEVHRDLSGAPRVVEGRQE